MTISTSTSRADYTGNGVTTSWSVPFYFLDNADLLVIRTQISTGVATTLALTTDYTLTGAGVLAGGTITLLSTPTADQRISILRNVPFTQTTDYVSGDPFPAESHERALDKLTMQNQQLYESIGRALTLAANSSGVSATLPSPTASNLIGWNGAGTALQNYSASALGVVIATTSWRTQTFNGDGVTTAFVLPTDAGVASNCDVTVGGVKQTADINFSYNPSTFTITFLTGAPPAGTNNVAVRYGAALATGTVTSTSITDSTAAGRAILTAASAAAQRTAMGLGTTDSPTFAGINGGALAGLRNRIIGGDFTTNPWQRGSSFTALSGYGPDRFFTSNSTAGVADVLKTADAPTAIEAGLFTQHCMHVDVTTADASVAAGDLYFIGTRIEGFNAVAFGFGQSGSRSVTLSFWVKSTKTGIFSASLQNSANNRSYVAEYTVNASNTWEKKAIIFPVDTSGTWLYDSGVGLRVSWALVAGSTFTGAAGAWTAADIRASTNQVNALDSTANDFKLALVQLESGSTATVFEQRPIGLELALCQRYYETGGFVTCTAVNTGGIYPQMLYKATKRAAPTLTCPRSISPSGLLGTDGSVVGFYQNANDSVATLTTWTASAEL